MRNITVIVTLVVAVSAHAQTPKEFIAAMKARRDGIKTVKYVLEVTSHQVMISDPSKGGIVDTKQKPVVKTHTLELDLQHGWMYHEERGEEYTPVKGGDPVIRPMHGCTTFHDGLMRSIQWPTEGATAVGTEPGRSADYAEFRGDLSRQQFQFEWRPAFANVGLLPLSTKPSLYPGEFQNAGPVEDDEDLLGESASRADRGRKMFECLQATDAKAGRKIEILVDSRNPSRVIQLAKTVGKVMYDQLECRYNVDGLQSWEYRSIWTGKLYYTSSFRIVSCRLNEPIDESRYHLSPDPGMVARKIQHSKSDVVGESETFRVRSNSSLEKITSDFDRKPAPATISIWWLVAGVGLSASAVAALVLYWRQRVRRRQSSTPKEPT